MALYDYEKEHLLQLRKNLAECTVLLRYNGEFPLEKAGKIALYGSGARNTIKGGTGSGEVNSRFFTTVEKGLEKAGFIITTKDWLDEYDKIREEAKKNFRKVIKERAKAKHTLTVIEGMGAVMPEPEYKLPLNGEGDVAVYVLSRISGEGNDREPVPGDILLSKTERRDIMALNRKYKRFLLVLNVGGVVDLSPVREVQNILLLSQLGVETGKVLADLLLGNKYPSGKLATTWTSWQDYCAVGDFGGTDDTLYEEGIYVGYRYFDSVGKKPLYPFGYGLGYTQFEISEEKIDVRGEEVTVAAKIKNIGEYAGKEVLQVYVSSPKGALDKPFQVLAGFTKTNELAMRDEEQVKVTFKLSDLASYDETAAAYVLEEGDYVVCVGNSSADTKVCGVLRLDETVVTCKVKNVLGKPSFEDWRPENEVRPDSSAVLETLKDQGPILVDVSSIMTKEVIYDAMADTDSEPESGTGSEEMSDIDETIGLLTDELLAYMNIGAFDPKGGIMSVIGNAGKSVPGAAGESTGMLKDFGVPSIVMADGPAGLRLCQKYYVDEKGPHSLGESMPESVLEYMPKPVSWLLSRTPKVKENMEIKEQYATAIPIGTAIAQSWNLDFAYKCGDIVGGEMERFGVHLWLAPALNIHRNIRCGRNFEYFSEDPLLSGLFAAALTNGVQSHPGCGTTIKHYAANNQETNRYGNNSQVSERAMREIYLKGFEICVKKSRPCAVMTSYNLLNGVHTSQNYGLIQDILRSEFGFDGIVMTDWVIAAMNAKAGKYPAPNAGKAAAAGNNLFMPGCMKDYKEVLEALQSGELTRDQLVKSAVRVYRMAMKLNKQ